MLQGCGLWENHHKAWNAKLTRIKNHFLEHSDEYLGGCDPVQTWYTAPLFSSHQSVYPQFLTAAWSLLHFNILFFAQSQNIISIWSNSGVILTAAADKLFKKHAPQLPVATTHRAFLFRPYLRPLLSVLSNRNHCGSLSHGICATHTGSSYILFHQHCLPYPILPPTLSTL